MNVKFLKGLSSSFVNLSKDSNTFYYLTDLHALYLGEKLIGNGVSMEMFDGLKNRVKALEDADFQTQINTIQETLKSIATSETVVAIDNRLKVVEGDYLKSSDKTELEGKVTALESAVNTKFNSYSTTEQMNAAIDADVKVVTDYIAEHEADWSAKTDISSLESRMTAVEKVADDAQTAEEVSNAINTEIAKLNISTTYATKAESEQVLVDAKAYTDEMKDTILGGEGLKETFDTLLEIQNWIEGDGVNATELAEAIAKETKDREDADKAINEEIAKCAKSADLGDLAGQDLEDLNLGQYAKSADISEDISKGVTAHGWGDHSGQGYLKAADIEDKADKSQLSDYLTIEAHNTFVNGNAALQSGINAEKVGQIQAGVDAKAVTDTLKSAAFKDASEFDGAGAAAAVQGATTNTVKDCVDAINALNSKTPNFVKKDDINAITTGMGDIIDHLTWGTF